MIILPKACQIFLKLFLLALVFEFFLNPEKSDYVNCVKSVPYSEFSGPYFPSFGLNMENFGVFLCIQ